MNKPLLPGMPLTPDDAIEVHRFIAIDVETTGFVSAEECHRMVEIALVTIENGKITDQWSSLLWPDRIVPYDVTAIHGLSLEELQDAPRFADVWLEIQKRIENSVWVFHNASFDLHFLVYEMKRLGVDLQQPIVDTLELARKFLNQRSHSLPTLAQTLELPVTPVHRSLSDTLATAHLFLRLLSTVREQRTLITLGDLQKAQGRPTPWPKIEICPPPEPYALYLHQKTPVRLTLSGGEIFRQFEGHLEGATVGTQAAFYTLRNSDGERHVLSCEEILKVEPISPQKSSCSTPAHLQQLKLF
ncbi:3'-5' exonuclease [Candidatus Acetothermia bacterium]|nr:3'-5' exonuclease [Candidatus Acetothermia bacterium]